MTRACAILGLLLAVCASARAFELRTHANMTSQAFVRSELATDPSLGASLGIELNSATALGTHYYDMTGAEAVRRDPHNFELGRIPAGVFHPASARAWLAIGSVREDDLSLGGCSIEAIQRWYHGHADHECSPREGALGTDRVTRHFFDPNDRQGLLANTNAVAWATGTVSPFAVPNLPDTSRENHYSWIDARRAMYFALSGRNARGELLSRSERDAYWATTFRALGNVLHLVQDMAQPQHTRVASHLGSEFEGHVELRARPDGVEVVSTRFGPRPLRPLNYGGPGATYPIPQFGRLSEYWSSQGAPYRGLADYSNRGFFTVDHNFGNRKYALPPSSLGAYNAVSLPSPVPDAVFKYLTAKVNDGFTGGASNDIRMTVQSRFATHGPYYGMSVDVYDDQADLLVQRAVAYSAGLLNHFFRGRIDCVKRSSIVSGCLIKNTGKEALSGTFELFYQGEDEKLYLVPGATWRDVALPPADPARPDEGFIAAFQPPTNPKPKTSGEYVLVFHGELGEEKPDLANGSFGGVAAKVIQPDSGALYVLTVKGGNFVVLRTDSGGTRLLAANELNPFEDLYSSINASWQQTGRLPVRSLIYSHKQAVFGSARNSYRTVATTVQYASGFSTVYNTLIASNEPGKDYVRRPGYSWVARSPDPAIGDFIFTPAVNRREITFVRNYSEGGVAKTASGTVAISFPPGISFYSLAVIEGSGTRLGEVSTTSSQQTSSTSGCDTTTNTASTTRYYDMVITLSASPAAAFTQIDETQAGGNTTTSSGINGCPGTGQGATVKRERHAIGVLDNVRRAMFKTEATSFTGFVAPPGACGNLITSTLQATYQFTDGAITFSSDCGAPSGSQPASPLLSDRAANQILVTNFGTSTFQGAPLPVNGAIREFSPLGELFYAHGDGSRIIHQPRDNRMPTFQLPAGTEAIIAAIWL